MGDSLRTGSNEIDFSFGEALAPDRDGLVKPIAVERRGACRGRRFGPRNKRWQCGWRAAARSEVGHGWIPMLAVNPAR